MINTLNHNSHWVSKLLIVSALIGAYHYRADLRDYFAKNETIQNAQDGVKWLIKELKPLTDEEKAQRAAYGAEQRKRAEELRKLGVNPHIKYVGPNDKEWGEAVADLQELKRLSGVGRE